MTIKYLGQSDFYDCLRSEVATYFREHHLKPTGDSRLYTKTAILVSLECFLFVVLVFFTPTNIFLSLFLCALLGITFALLGFNVMHDASHGSYSSKPWVNRVLSLLADHMGASSRNWKLKHVILHHTYTNTMHDDDINLKPIMRIHPEEKPLWFHRFQAWYAIFLYFLQYIEWVFYNDFKKYFRGKIGKTKITFSRMEHFTFWSTKLLYIGVFLVLPMFMVGVVPTIVGYLVMGAACGLALSIVFQLAHVVETSMFPTANAEGKVDLPWAEAQVQETTDFAVNSKLAAWFLGGLNFQVVHHLFPKVSHVHYPALSKIVARVCKKYNITYNQMTFWGALKSHFKTLDRLGNMPMAA